MTFQKTERSRLKRRNQRGHYDEETIYRILDAGLIAHIGYIHDGHPFVTPTAYWRVDDSLYWHGASSGRFIKAGSSGPVCVTVSHFDGLVFARSGFHHSALHRTVMAFGTCTLITAPEEVKAATDVFLDRLLPHRSDDVRPITKQELKATTLVRFNIDEASAKIRGGGVLDDETDYDFPVWAGLLRTAQTIAAVEDDKRLCANVKRPAGLDTIAPGMRLEDYLLEVREAT